VIGLSKIKGFTTGVKHVYVPSTPEIAQRPLGDLAFNVHILHCMYSSATGYKIQKHLRSFTSKLCKSWKSTSKSGQAITFTTATGSMVKE
jgi:hypothetical protein